MALTEALITIAPGLVCPQIAIVSAFVPSRGGTNCR